MKAIVDRVKAILTTPRTEWPVIEGEASVVADIYKNYLIFLAAIPALASFLGLSVFGISVGPVSMRMPFFSGLISAVVGYALTLVIMYVLAMIADALAPTFKGTKNLNNAFKLVAYGSTAAMVGGIFYLLPALSMLAMLAGLYSLYLIYLGIPVMMKCPQEKALPYTAVLVVCGLVAGILVSGVMHMFTPGPMRM